MEKQILNFTANEQILVCENPIKISTNKVNYIQAHFDLGENWSGFDSVRAVWFNDFNCISTVLDSLGNCAVPFEVMKRKGCVKVNLVGSISEDDVLTDRLTSYPVVAVIVDCTAQITGANTSPITPSEFEQFAAAVHEDAERAEAGASASEQSAQNAHASEQNASQSAQSAHDDKIAIEQAIAEVIQQIEDFEQVQVVVNTLPPSSPATSDFTDGVLTLGIPQGVKGDTGNGIQSIAKTGTSGLVDTYTITYTDGQTTTFTVTNGAKGDTGNGIASIEKTSTVGLVDTYTITYTDGTTSTFTVTNGEKGDKGDQGEVSLSELEDATIVQTLSDNTPYNYRRTNGGNGSGHREYDEIVGASVGWNQLVDPSSIRVGSINGITLTYDSTTHKFKASGTATAFASVQITSREIPSIGGHKYFLPQPNGASATTYFLRTSSDLFWNFKNIGMETADVSQTFRFVVRSGQTVDVEFYLQLIDLTLLLGSTIADYVYTLEQSTAGSGVTWLKTHFPKLFDNGFQPFDSGSIKSVSGLTAHEMVGVNQWDEESESGTFDQTTGAKTPSASLTRSVNPIKVIPNTEYCRSKVGTSQACRIFFYDADMNLISSEVQTVNVYTFTTPSNCHYINIAYQNSITNVCINLSDTSINGQYFTHESHTYTLDSSVTLRGQYKLDANNNLYADGDVWKSSGEVSREWKEATIDNTANITATSSTPASGNGYMISGVVYDCVASEYVDNLYTPVGSSASVSSMNLGQYKVYENDALGRIVVIDSATTVDAFKAKLAQNPLKVVYKTSSPTTEQATPYTSPQWCDSHGTEEYVGSELPVGHNTDYPMTLIDTADGLSNGTYEPRITVANGKKTVTWVSV